MELTQEQKKLYTPKQIRFWEKVEDELCECGALKSQHAGVQGHGGLNQCPRFRWVCFVDKDGKKIPNLVQK